MGASADALPPILLGLLLAVTPGTLSANPGLVARITSKGLEYAAKEGLLALQRDLHKITLPDFTGDFKIRHVGRGSYNFHRLAIHSCELPSSTLKPLPGQGLSLSISDSSIGVQGQWKVKKSFLKIQGSFDLHVRGLTISVDLLLGTDPSGRLTVTASHCSSHISDVDVDISGGLGWLLKLFHNQIESRFRKVLEDKVCEMVQKSVASDLQPYLQTLPVTAKIDSLAGIDYSLVGPPQATAQALDLMFKGEIFDLHNRSKVAAPVPVMSLPEDNQQMVYFAISGHVFNIASHVYQQAGYLSFFITDDMIPSDSTIRLTTKSFRTFAPRIGRLYPNMNLELQGTVIAAPLLNFSPGNLSLAPQMDIQAFVLLPSSVQEPVFRLAVATNISAMMTFNSNKVTGFLNPGKVQVELKESRVGMFNVELLEALLNYYLLNTLYPQVNDKLAKGFPLPLLHRIQLYDLILQIHKDFLFLGANVQYTRV
ncbi:lipopolysaccharide-binding protein [Perognathus longimembris pacificus]|uniref:lipopolysaccharide-binding protein n=1 Tax=Perognathus longimembris pacificus TaxID=214514 RepID=UPI002019D650|nr:lipopolysaccharide-binding protein [Perognathus longimembris pacificus]